MANNVICYFLVRIDFVSSMLKINVSLNGSTNYKMLKQQKQTHGDRN